MTAGFQPEEPWEAEIEAMLGALPAVDPPDGFLADALDRRPLHAARIVAGLALATIVVAALSAASGLIDQAVAIPEIGLLTSRHSAAQAGLDGAGTEVADRAGEGGPPPVSLPGGYRREAMFEAGDLRQAVYSREGETVSVFVQDGKVDWAALPESGRVQIAGELAWVDEAREVTVLQAGEQAVTIIGLPPEDVATLIAALAPGEPSLRQRSAFDRSAFDRSAYDHGADLVAKMAEQLGFPG